MNTTTPTPDPIEHDPIYVADDFEPDDTDCGTGRMNELGGCEPVGTEFDPAPADRGPQVVPPRTPDRCLLWDGTSLEEGEWKQHTDISLGTTDNGRIPCGPVRDQSPLDPDVVAGIPTFTTGVTEPQSLPETGPADMGIAFVGAALIVAGIAARLTARLPAR